MRHTPLFICCVAKEASPEMIVYSATGYSRQSGHHHIQARSIVIAGISGIGPVSQEVLDARGHSEFNALAETALTGIVSLG